MYLEVLLYEDYQEYLGNLVPAHTVLSVFKSVTRKFHLLEKNLFYCIMTTGGEKVYVKGAKNPIICILGNLRNYESVSFSGLASELFNRYQFPLVKTIESPFGNSPFYFFGFCKEGSCV